MSHPLRLLLVTFLGTVVVVLAERGIYFFLKYLRGFSDAENLAFAMIFGLVYVVGAVTSGRTARRLGERRWLGWTIGCQFLAYASLVYWDDGWLLYAAWVVIGFFSGAMWPVVESFVSAGQDERSTRRSLGVFSIVWSSGVPLTVMMVGPLIAWRESSLFVVSAVLGAVLLMVLTGLPARPAYASSLLPSPPAAEVAREKRLMRASRWAMVCGYSLMFALAPLMPGLFQRMGYGVEHATLLTSVIDWSRTLGFVVLTLWLGWHGRRDLIVAAALLLPVTFFLILFAPNLPVLLLAEALFGLANAVTYQAALYYAMVVKHASVDAGGEHEGLIGAGFFLGPLVGWIGVMLGPMIGSDFGAMLLGVGPLVIVCTARAVGVGRGDRE